MAAQPWLSAGPGWAVARHAECANHLTMSVPTARRFAGQTPPSPQNRRRTKAREWAAASRPSARPQTAADVLRGTGDRRARRIVALYYNPSNSYHIH